MSEENTMESLWPKLQRHDNAEAPVAILRQQAAALGKQTRNILEGYVRRTESPKPTILSFSFEVVAPGLGDYRVELLTVYHEVVPFYPVHVTWNGARTPCTSEDEFKEKLRAIFNDSATQAVLQSLLDQSFSLAA